MRNTAQRACSTCRKQKRKCTRELPECSLCLKHGRRCDYNESIPATTRPDVQQLPSSRPHISPSSPGNTHASPFRPNGSSQDLALPLLAQSKFPASFFLDHDVFQLLGRSIEPATAKFPLSILDPVRDQARIRSDVDVYFNSTHTFFPIISKTRLYREISNTGNSINADTALLLSALHLHVQPSDDSDPSSRETYKAVKDYFSQVEASNAISLRLLQAALLISLYEVSNAVYPMAYLTVGHCARIGHALGIHARKHAPQISPAPASSTELEERNRTWWAVILLDRYVNLGGKNRPFACEDARPDAYLPMDDGLTLVQPLAVSTSTTIAASYFARTCQAAHLLSKVLRHLNDFDTDQEFRYQEAIQIHRTIQALSSTILLEAEEQVEKTSDSTAHLVFCTAIGLCFSALFSLYNEYSCVDKFAPEQLKSPHLRDMQQQAFSGLGDICDAVLQLSARVYAAAELGGLMKTNPLIADCLYQAAATYLWYSHETGVQEWHGKMMEIKKLLVTMSVKWKSAGEYIQLLEAYEASDKF
ncbi:unnamed protein product [Clonostachys rosea f. rosea IK726]|uniref:Zn(2)-C6 fungal-type domain-containing protein n=2 Tax=Bionectria ochroleuca TaxID=29856 RepID=A0A0B7KQ51_BIOOC|nr:unnamed protein product [Clonostachys rosea f. rosea IK726]